MQLLQAVLHVCAAACFWQVLHSGQKPANLQCPVFKCRNVLLQTSFGHHMLGGKDKANPLAAHPLYFQVLLCCRPLYKHCMLRGKTRPSSTTLQSVFDECSRPQASVQMLHP